MASLKYRNCVKTITQTPMDLQKKKIEFPNNSGEMLAGLLELPEAPAAFALFAHCFTRSKDIAAASRISRSLAAQGVATLRFDFTGRGNSDGDFANTNFSSNVEDLVSAADYLRQGYMAPAIWIGHSLGGIAVMIGAEHIQESKAVITIASPSNANHVRENFSVHEAEIIDKGFTEVTLAGRTFIIKRQFLEDIEQYDRANHVATLGKALLIFHSPADTIVPIGEAALIYRHAKHPKSFISLDQADHLLSKKEDAEYVASIIAAWVQKYIT